MGVEIWNYDASEVSWGDLWALDILAQESGELRGVEEMGEVKLAGGVNEIPARSIAFDTDVGGRSKSGATTSNGISSAASPSLSSSNDSSRREVADVGVDDDKRRSGAPRCRLFVDMTVGLCEREGLLDAHGADHEKFRKMIERLEDEYSENPYHCALHATDVLWSTHTLFGALPEDARAAFTPTEVMGLYLAAAGHDAGHFRKNNAFLKNSGHELATTYPTSTLENFHADVVLRLLRDPRHGVSEWRRRMPTAARSADSSGVGGVSVGSGETERGENEEKEKENVKDGVAEVLNNLVRELILATDMARHGEFVARFREWVK